MTAHQKGCLHDEPGVTICTCVPPSWSQLFPEGRVICYEGDGDPDEFAAEVLEVTGFDPRTTARGEWVTGRDCWFLCPAEHLDAVYGTERWPVGS